MGKSIEGVCVKDFPGKRNCFWDVCVIVIAREHRKDFRMTTLNTFTRENTVIEYSQDGIGGQHIRETRMLEGTQGTRQKSLSNAFRGWNTDWFGRDEGYKREIVAARACLIVQNRTLGSWIHGDGQEDLNE